MSDYIQLALVKESWKAMEDSSACSKWLCTEEEMRNTPSIRGGITFDQELTFRQKQAMLIQTIGLKSGLTQLAVNTSVIFMHRFFMHRTVKSFPRVQLAVGFAFAGGKVEESARKLEHLIRTAVDVVRSNKNREFLDKSDPLTYELDNKCRSSMDTLCQSNCNTDSAAYVEMRKLVLECETEIYAVIGFQLQIVHPHNYVIRMCALLGAENIKDISQYAYNLATASSQLTMLCLKYRPETIATMCLNIAAKAHSVRFEPMKEPNVKWYQVIVPTTDFAEIEAVSEEFLHLIKGCPLLPSWMANLARMTRVNNSRAMPVPSRGPGASSASVPQPSRQSHVPGIAASAGIPQPSSSQSHSVRSSQQTSTLISSSSQILDAQASQHSSAPASGPHSQPDTVISPNSRPSSEGGSSGGPALSETHPRDTVSSQGHSSSHSKTHPPPGSSQMRPPQSSAASSGPSHHHHHHRQQQQQHRPHSSSSGRPPVPEASASGSSRPQPPKALPPVSGSSQAPRLSTQNMVVPGQSNHSSSRPAHDSARVQHDPTRHHNEPNRPHQESARLSAESSCPRDHSRPHDQVRSQDPLKQLRSDRRTDPGSDTRRPAPHSLPRDDAGSDRSQRSLAEVASLPHPNEPSPHTPPTSPPPVKSQSPEAAPELSDLLPASGDAPDIADGGSRNSSPDNTNKGQLNLNPDRQRSTANQGPKALSLSMYRDRVSARSRVPEAGGAGEDACVTPKASVEPHGVDSNQETLISSPTDRGIRPIASGSDISTFTKPQDSPNNPRIKIKVKRDPSSGERHAIKYADNGLKIKIKPLRSDNSAGGEAEAGPSGVPSRTNTPREEGEIVEETPPSSERKSEPLRIRLLVPKSDGGTSCSRRDSDQGSNGYSGGERERERESGHRSHHHGHHHHRSHHSHKSKKHSSKHDRSRHEGKSSSKRSSSAMDYYDERPAKSSRADTYQNAPVGGEIAHRGFESGSHISSRTLQHQNSGFNIMDAFSSTMPNNIFDDDEDDAGHAHPPITPTVEAAHPPHHERFHQLLAQHRANEARKPPLPKGPPPSSPPPPPPSPPTL